MLMLSLVLHGVTFIVIFLLYQKLNQSQDQLSVFEEKEKEIEALFQSYLLEIKDENEKFAKQLRELKAVQSKADRPEVNSGIQTEDTSTENIEVETTEGTDFKPEEVDTEIIQSNYKPPVTYESEGVTYQPSVESRILQRYSSGESIDQIAKDLNLGVTEVELIVKFQSSQSI